MFNILKQGDNHAPYIMEFVIDARVDLQDLPTDIPMGSSAICLEDGSMWMLNSSKEWKKI